MNETKLPIDYRLIGRIDGTHNKLYAFLVGVLSFALAIATLVGGFFWKGIFDPSLLFDPLQWVIALAVAVAGYIVYVLLHEGTHWLVMYALSRVKPRFCYRFPLSVRVEGMAYFRKWQYIAVAIAPALLWGVAFGIACALTKGAWFWCFCFLQAGNVGASASDIALAVRTAFRPKNVLVYDTGAEQFFYLPPKEKGGREQ